MNTEFAVSEVNIAAACKVMQDKLLELLTKKIQLPEVITLYLSGASLVM